MTPLWAARRPITVEADDWGTPQRFTWRGVVHPVAKVVNRWRVDENWWGDEQTCREYFRLVTVSGLLVDVYRDMAGGGWYVQRVYD